MCTDWQHIEDVLRHADFRNSIDYLFLVGGFAESPLLQQAVRGRFDRDITVVIPQVDIPSFLTQAKLKLVGLAVISLGNCWRLTGCNESISVEFSNEL